MSLVLSNPLRAAQVPYLYSAELPVADQQPKTRQHAIKKGLQQVLARVTGDTNIASKPGVATMIKQAERYITQFSYRQVNRTFAPSANRAGFMGTHADESRRILIAQYQAQAIEKQLATLNVSIWPAGRPRVLIWLTDDGQYGRQWVRFNSQPLLLKQLESSLKQRGLPYELPFLDFTDGQRLSLGMAGGLIVDSIRSASARYQSDAILAGRSYVDKNGTTHSSWVLIDGTQTIRFRTASQPGENLFGPVINQVADYFAAQYTKPAALQSDGSSSSALRIRVLGIQKIDQYAGLVKYLQKLSGIKHVYPTLVSAEHTEFHINTELNLQQFHSLIKLDKQLLRSPKGRTNYSSKTITYQWLP
ncbi:MAG: DUF2066 domain-containing protein [Pseudomonadales bacterium]|nr:DUF2066 domain-containing protein [Pseudomonadales bacterium]